ncbi:MAG TPA: hypothetical protein VEW47_03830 [Candidatus Dormibacteraeota bacterium]|nr:hypothetical protein [Candidatus Dormibacteraeota bacterium]
MTFPGRADEIALHERVLAGDPVAPVDVFKAWMDPLVNALRADLRCSDDEAYDSGIDAVLAYLEEPGKYDRGKGRLSSYVMDIAKKRAIDRLRTRTAAERRDDGYAAAVDLRTMNPKDVLEAEVEARELWQKVENAVPDERDRRMLKLILEGERSTDAFAEALELGVLSPLAQRRLVKQHRDRLMKVLERLGTRLGHDEDA